MRGSGGTVDYSFAIKSLVLLFFVIDPLGNVPIFEGLTADFPGNERIKVARKAIVSGTLVLVVFAIFGTAIFDYFGFTAAAFRISGGLILLLISIEMIRGNRATKQHRESSLGLALPAYQVEYEKEKDALQEYETPADAVEAESAREKPDHARKKTRSNAGKGLLSNLTRKLKEGKVDEEEAERESVGIVPLGVPMFAGPGSITTVMLFMTDARQTDSSFDVLWVFACIFIIMGLSYPLLRYSAKIFDIFGKAGAIAVARIMGIVLAAMSIQLMLRGIVEAFPQIVPGF
jgi:small neutral amino acid transporter SnatA (MarC family)